MKKKALGKGLKAFFPEEYEILKTERFIDIDIEKIKPNPLQPRTKFTSESIDELARSIETSGILQPIVVTPENDHYKIIVGERRWRASQKIGLTKIPAIIRTIDHVDQIPISLTENLQREDLNPVEIAMAYQKMIKELNYTQQKIAEKVGKDRASVANYLRLLKLPKNVQTMLIEGKISMGHARALITLDDCNVQTSLSHQIVKKNLSVRDTEKMINRLKQKPSSKKTSVPDPDLLSVQEELIKILGTKVSISGNTNKGVLKIHYFSLEDLNRIYKKIKE